MTRFRSLQSPLMEPDSLKLVPKECNHVPDLFDWEEGPCPIPVPAIRRAVEYDFPDAEAHAPRLMMVGNAESVPPVNGTQVAGDGLDVRGVAFDGDDTSHQGFVHIFELYLLSSNPQVVRLKVVGDMNDDNFCGHNVFEIGDIELASFFSTVRMSTVACIRVHRPLAQLPIV